MNSHLFRLSFLLLFFTVLTTVSFASVSLKNWNSHYCGTVTQTNEGIEISGVSYKYGNLLYSTTKYNLLNTTSYIKFKPKSDKYAQFVVGVSGLAASYTHTTDHSYAGSIEVNSDEWLYATIIVNEATVNIVVAKNNYFDKGGTQISQRETNFVEYHQELMKNGVEFYIRFGDNYAGVNTKMFLGEFSTNAPIVEHEILKIFNFDTDDGSIKGNYKIENGFLYINATSLSDYVKLELPDGTKSVEVVAKTNQNQANSHIVLMNNDTTTASSRVVMDPSSNTCLKEYYNVSGRDVSWLKVYFDTAGAIFNAESPIKKVWIDKVIAYGQSNEAKSTQLKDTLLATKNYSVSGSFASYDFAGVSDPFDWVFITPLDVVYQLQGIAPSSNDVFGWKKVQVSPTTPSWYMAYLGDWDNDGNSKFDWILVGNGFDAVYKLEGVTNAGTFLYSDKLDISYTVSSDKKTITFGDAGGSPIDIGDLFPDVDEEELLQNPPGDKISTISNNAQISTTPTSGVKVELTTATVVSEASNSITIKSSANITSQHIGEPLFVDGIFKGMITSTTNSSNGTVLGLKDAQKLSDVYSSFDVVFKNEEVLKAVQRSIKTQQLGRYDYLNKEPLQISVSKKPVTNKRGLTSDEVVLRIDIPKDYYVPITPHKRSCDFWNMECTITTEGEMSKNISLGDSYTKSGITFSTEGSYIEIGIGAYLRAHYDYNVASLDTLDFDFAQSAYFKSNMVVSVSGILSKEWSTTIKLIGDIDVEIIHPYSAVAKTSVIVSPNIVFGVDGTLKGSVTASSYVERSGEIRFGFNSTDLSHSIENSVGYTPTNLNKDSVTLNIEADGNAYIYPAITMLPSLRFIRITPPITLMFIRSGIKLNTNINGKLETGFVVENDGEIQQSSASEASLTTSLEGLIEGMWYVRISPIDLYSSSDYSTIFSTGKLNVLEWKAILLNDPVIDVKEHPGDYNRRDISFKLDIDEKYQSKIYYYYTLDGKDIAVAGIEAHKPVWRWGDMPIEVEKNTKVKVRAVLYNKDISKSIWAWGTSVSQQKDTLVSLIHRPNVSPESRSFEGSLWVSMTQEQGYEIMYQKDGAAAVKYTIPIELTKDTTLVVYARDEVDEEKVYSEKQTYTYDQCEDNEKLESGKCVENVSSLDGEDEENDEFDIVTLWNEWEETFDGHFNTYARQCSETYNVPNDLAYEISYGDETISCWYNSDGSKESVSAFIRGSDNGGSFYTVRFKNGVADYTWFLEDDDPEHGDYSVAKLDELGRYISFEYTINGRRGDDQYLIRRDYEENTYHFNDYIGNLSGYYDGNGDFIPW